MKTLPYPTKLMWFSTNKMQLNTLMAPLFPSGRLEHEIFMTLPIAVLNHVFSLVGYLSQQAVFSSKYNCLSIFQKILDLVVVGSLTPIGLVDELLPLFSTTRKKQSDLRTPSCNTVPYFMLDLLITPCTAARTNSGQNEAHHGDNPQKHYRR